LKSSYVFVVALAKSNPSIHNIHVCIGFLIQDSAWLDWFVQAEAAYHEGLASRFLVGFAKGRMVGPLRLKMFFANVYRPFAKKFLAVLLTVYSPRKDVFDEQDPVGRYPGLLDLNWPGSSGFQSF
jgi:hypothetical protein